MAVIIVNFKAYRESMGRNAVKLAEKISSRRFDNVRIIAAVQPTDIAAVSRIMPVFAQHVDAADFGAHTGHVIPEIVKETGAEGAVINHCEKPLELAVIERTVMRAKSCNLKTIVCVPAPEIARAVSAFNPDLVSIEPPALVGTGRASSQAMPELIKETIKGSRGIPVICGAGISSGDDAKKAIELGCSGIMLASAVVKAGDPAKKIEELALALRD